jgi:general secretion pathway protein D
MMLSCRCRRWYAVASAAIFFGCQPAPSGLLPLEQPGAMQPATPRINGTIPRDESLQHPFVSRGVAPGAPPGQSAQTSQSRLAGGPSSPPGVTAQGGGVTLNFLDTDIREIARAILGTTLKLNFTIDPRVHGTASIDTGTPLPRSALLPTLETLLNQNGATVVERGGVYSVVPNAAGVATNTGATGIGAGAQMVQLRYTAAADLAKVLEPYVAEGGKIAADQAGNALLVSGDAQVRETLVGLIRAFDTDLLAGRSYALFPAGDKDPAKLATEFQTVLQAQGQGPLAQLVNVLPMDRVNAILVVSSQPRYIAAAERFFGLEKRVEDATARTWHVYYVQNGQSMDLAYTLQRAFTPNNVTAQPTAPGATTPSAPGTTMGTGPAGTSGAAGTSGGFGISGAGGATGGTGGGMQLAGAAGGTGGGMQLAGGAGAAGAPAGGGSQGSTAPGAAPATEALSSETGEGAGNENRIRIIPNTVNNALIIYATPVEYSVIEGMLRKIDIIPLQVLIEATIAEVDLNDALQYGTQWFFKTGEFTETLGTPTINATSIPSLTSLNFPSSSPVFVVNRGVNFALAALAAVTKVKVLSAPQVMVLDNQPASVQVGQQVPVLTGQATSTLVSGAPTVNSISYQNTGVIMQVTPRVNSGGLVTLDIAQEVSDVAAAAVNTVTGSPTFNDQVFRTRVAVQDGQTIGMAGLITDNSSVGNAGIPLLKDIPLLGTLFSTQSNTRARTELLVLITPHVIRDQRDARALTEDLRGQLSGAALVPQQLQHLHKSGFANPNGL